LTKTNRSSESYLVICKYSLRLNFFFLKSCQSWSKVSSIAFSSVNNSSIFIEISSSASTKLSTLSFVTFFDLNLEIVYSRYYTSSYIVSVALTKIVFLTFSSSDACRSTFEWLSKVILVLVILPNESWIELKYQLIESSTFDPTDTRMNSLSSFC